MKERPILFSGPMVRAILDGRKTQTRRVVKPQPISVSPTAIEFRPGCKIWPSTYLSKSPYGKPGDRLWVRETWCMRDKGGYWYRASHPDILAARVSGWKPSIHMPRLASRITLEITGVRVERLQSITDADAIAEGVAQDVENIPAPFADPVYYWHNYDRTRGIDMCADARTSFVTLWESINGAGSWDANPWVWVVEIKPLDIKK